MHGPDVHYVLRLGADFRTRQFLLFRDLEDPDLWLATDGRGRWGEVNGGERDDLAGCWDVALGCSPSTNSIAVRALGLAVGESAEIDLALIDVETLEVTARRQRYTRLAEHRWRYESLAAETMVELDVDADGLVLDYPGAFHRAMP